MYFIALVGLLAGTVTAKSQKYAIPANLNIADDCKMPGEYEITNFAIYTNKLNGTTTSFHFADMETDIDTECKQNSTSKSSTTGATARYPCDNANVEFIYKTSKLTVMEAVCPGISSNGFEASGSTTFNITCVATYSGTLCTSPLSVEDNFTSLEPRPSS